MKTVIMTVLILGISACSSKPEVKEFPKNADAKEEITNLELAIENSKSENFGLLAPVSYEEAKDSLIEAKKLEKDDKSDKRVLKEVALGQAYLEQARENAKESSSKLNDILLARNDAMAVDAHTLLSKEFKKLDDKVKEETTKLEKDKDDDLSKKRAEFLTGYRDLELKAIKKRYLGESKQLIDQAVKNGARELTPKTLATTNTKYKEADDFITQHRHDTYGIESMAVEVLRSARNLEATVATARGLKGATPEETALRMREEEDRLNKAEAERTILASSNEALSEEQKLNAIYEEARNKFSADEAEVYKQGKNLVIRLRSLEFPKNQAVLKGEDFTLLKKVEDVIASFDRSKVIVEGHTDSTGSKEINKKISDERANAVKQYLEANASDMVTEIESVGYGFEKPLASNKTPEGRAQNRRVDVIITPSEI